METVKKVYTRRREKIIALKPDTVRIYPTVVIEGTYLDELRRKGLYSPLPLQPAVELALLYFGGSSKEASGSFGWDCTLRRRWNVGGQGGATIPPSGSCARVFLNGGSWRINYGSFPRGVKFWFRVPASELSKTIGQKKANIIWAEQMGYRLTVRSGQSVKKGELKAELLPSANIINRELGLAGKETVQMRLKALEIQRV